MVLLYFTMNKSFNDKKIGLITVYDIWLTVIPNNRTFGAPPRPTMYLWVVLSKHYHNFS